MVNVVFRHKESGPLLPFSKTINAAQPGVYRVVWYDDNGRPVPEASMYLVMRNAAEPHRRMVACLYNGGEIESVHDLEFSERLCTLEEMDAELVIREKTT